MNAPRFGLSARTVEQICGVLAKYPSVERAVLYGSRAKGNFKNGSDIDLTLFGEGLGFPELLGIMDALDDLLLPYTIDLSIFDLLDHVELREHIARVGQEFYHRQVASESLPFRAP